jgi:hypothetical protein
MSLADDTIQGTPENSDEYEEMIAVLDEIIELGLSKLTGDGRIKDTERAKARCRYMKRTEQAIRAKRQVIKDKHLQEMGRTLEAIQESDEFDL